MSYPITTANIKAIRLWEDNPDKSRISQVVKIEFSFPCSWTVLSIDELKEILRLWIIGEEKKYPPTLGFQGRQLLFNEIKSVFEAKE